MKKIITLQLLGLITGGLSAFHSFGQTADLQIIHNAADPAAETVDIYVDGALAVDNFTFRTATTFISLPANVSLNIGVAPGNSTSVTDTLKNFELTLADGERYVAIANGVLDDSQFAANPDGESTTFTLFISDSLREMATNMSDVDFLVAHGSTDAPTVDVVARNIATILNDAKYGDVSGYISVPAGDYILDVTTAAGSPIVASFEAELTALAGGTAVVFASGFLDSTQNQNGHAFGIFAALANGSVVEFSPVSLARLQVIHNASDPAADEVDVYVNGNLLLDDFMFRHATPFIDVPAGVVLEIGVAPGNSVSVSDTLKNFSLSLQNGNTYLAVANGVLDPMMFAANPDGRSTAFTIFVQDMMRETAVNSTEVDFRVIHGTTDAPGVDVMAGATTLVNNALYSDITSYLSVPPAVYDLNITPANNNTIVLASFQADLSSLAGGSAVVLASGFYDPSQNQNGPAFGLIAVLADGTVITLNNTTSVDELSRERLNVYPNPASQNITINNPENLDLKVRLLDITGKEITSYLLSGTKEWNVSALPKGYYFIEYSNENSKRVDKLVIQ